MKSDEKNIIIQIKTNKMRKTLLENSNESHAICMAHIKKRSGNKENRNYSEMVHGKQTKIKQTQHDK